jgi:MoaA/NifB/PqqE/SkfB family radical SAM enzyme
MINLSNTVVELKLGYSCIQNCTFCCFKDIKGLNMTNHEISQNLQYIYENIRNPDVFILSGGEPTIYKNFWDILDFIKTKIIAKKVVIHTNGLFFSNLENATKIRKYVATLMVSFHTLNDKFFKKNMSKRFSVKDVMQAIKNLKDNKVEVITNTLLFKENINELERIAKFLIDNFIAQMEFRIPYALSKSIPIDNLLISDFDKLAEVLYNICKKYSKNCSIIFHPSSICLISQFTKNDEMIEYLKQFCMSNNFMSNLSFYFFDKLHQCQRCIISKTQISAVMPKFRNYFFTIPPCNLCLKRKICHGLPMEYKSKLSKNTKFKSIFINS